MKAYLTSSVGRKQIIAVTGLALVLFLIAHLSGNLLIFGGPEAFNAYAKKLHSLGPLLYVARAGLIVMFVTHIAFTILLIKENKTARGHSYAVKKDISGRSFATKTMRYSGPLLALFLLLHLSDFTWNVPWFGSGAQFSAELGLYAKVANSFLNPIRTIIYILAMFAIGLHLSHGIQSVFQTMGLTCTEKMKTVKKISLSLGLIIAVGFASLPVYLNVVALGQ